MTTLSDPDAVLAALRDEEEYALPPVDASAETGIAWLRATVARFTTGPAHARRRGHAADLLAAIDPDDLRRRSRGRSAALLASADDPLDVMSTIARPVPVTVLAESLGVDRDLTADIAAVARAYHPHTDAGADADAAVAALTGVFGGRPGRNDPDEPIAARIGLLVQAYDATAGLIGGAILAGSVAAALGADAPVRRTRRVHNGQDVLLDITTMPFGAGPHRCPGSDHATAIAAGVLDALTGWRPTAHPVEYEPGPALRIPARLLMTRG